MAWSDTPEGQNVNTAYEAFKTLMNTNLPAHKDSLWALANRAFKGS